MEEGAFDCSLHPVDMHAHLPWWARDPGRAGGVLVDAWREACIETGLAIAVEPSIRLFRSNVDERRVYNALGEYMDLVALSRIPMLTNLVYKTRDALEEHVDFLREHTRTTEEVLEAARLHPEIIPVASYNPDLGVDGNISRLRRILDKIIGVKIFPTLHFIRPNHGSLSKLYRELEGKGKIVMVHTGCDPGVWELPSLCSHARPSLVEDAARRHRDLVFVVAHLGSYSALTPGIFFHEAVKALSRDNVYADTSAVDPYFVRLAVEESGWDKILFGSDYPYVTGTKPVDWVREISLLDIPGKAKEAILRGNAVRLLRSLGPPAPRL